MFVPLWVHRFLRSASFSRRSSWRISFISCSFRSLGVKAQRWGDLFSTSGAQWSTPCYLFTRPVSHPWCPSLWMKHGHSLNSRLQKHLTLKFVTYIKAYKSIQKQGLGLRTNISKSITTNHKQSVESRIVSARNCISLSSATSASFAAICSCWHSATQHSWWRWWMIKLKFRKLVHWHHSFQTHPHTLGFSMSPISISMHPMQQNATNVSCGTQQKHRRTLRVKHWNHQFLYIFCFLVCEAECIILFLVVKCLYATTCDLPCNKGLLPSGSAYRDASG